MYVADNAQLQSPAPRTIGQLSVSLLGWLARRHARKVASQAVELVKTPDECRVNFEAPMHGQRPQVSFRFQIGQKRPSQKRTRRAYARTIS